MIATSSKVLVYEVVVMHSNTMQNSNEHKPGTNRRNLYDLVPEGLISVSIKESDYL